MYQLRALVARDQIALMCVCVCVCVHVHVERCPFSEYTLTHFSSSQCGISFEILYYSMLYTHTNRVCWY